MLTLMLTSFRLLALLAIISAYLVSTLILYPLLKPEAWSKIVSITIMLIRKSCAIQLEVIGKNNHDYLLQNTLIVANHFCWLDTIILNSVYFISFVGKIEMLRWPLLNRVISSCGTIFINRHNKRDILQINPTLSKALISGKCIGLFPEGAINDGHSLLPFKAPLLEAGITAKSTVIPMLILYYRKDGQFAYELSYQKVNLMQNIRRTLMLNGLHIKIVILPAIAAADFKSRAQLCQHLYQVMSAAYQQR